MNLLLIYGGKGWIGEQLIQFLYNDFNSILSSVRADDEVGVANELDRIKPTHVLSIIGRTHGPGFSTIDYLEQSGKLVENVRDNLYAPLVLAIQCKMRNIHYTYFGTGCIFSKPHTDGSYTEDSLPDFTGSGYSTIKGFTDRLMHSDMFNTNTLNIRIRMPITNTVNPRNFITKITTYDKICSVHNSMTVLPTLLPILVDMMKNKTVGTINMTNPGVISHNEILEMYKEIVDPDFTWKNFTIEEQDKILASKRSNNYLDTSKLESMYPDVPDIKIAVRQCLNDMKIFR